MELPWLFHLALKNIHFLGGLYMSAAKETALFIAVLFWPLRKSLALKVIWDCGSGSTKYQNLPLEICLFLQI
jgi:hypothetical protein